MQLDYNDVRHRPNGPLAIIARWRPGSLLRFIRGRLATLSRQRRVVERQRR